MSNVRAIFPRCSDAPRWHRVLALLVRWYLGGLFILASVHKILDPGAFAIDIATYQMLPLWTVNATAITLPWLELFAGAMLCLGWRTPGAMMAVLGMLLAFVVALLAALARDLDLSCGCFAATGMEADPISWWTVLRDLVWIAMALYVLRVDTSPIGIHTIGRRRGRAPCIF